MRGLQGALDQRGNAEDPRARLCLERAREGDGLPLDLLAYGGDRRRHRGGRGPFGRRSPASGDSSQSTQARAHLRGSRLAQRPDPADPDAALHVGPARATHARRRRESRAADRELSLQRPKPLVLRQTRRRCLLRGGLQTTAPRPSDHGRGALRWVRLDRGRAGARGFHRLRRRHCACEEPDRARRLDRCDRVLPPLLGYAVSGGALSGTLGPRAHGRAGQLPTDSPDERPGGRCLCGDPRRSPGSAQTAFLSGRSGSAHQSADGTAPQRRNCR